MKWTIFAHLRNLYFCEHSSVAIKTLAADCVQTLENRDNHINTGLFFKYKNIGDCLHFTKSKSTDVVKRLLHEVDNLCTSAKSPLSLTLLGVNKNIHKHIYYVAYPAYKNE